MILFSTAPHHSYPLQPYAAASQHIQLPACCHTVLPCPTPLDGAVLLRTTHQAVPRRTSPDALASRYRTAPCDALASCRITPCYSAVAVVVPTTPPSCHVVPPRDAPYCTVHYCAVLRSSVIVCTRQHHALRSPARALSFRVSSTAYSFPMSASM